MSNTAKFDLAQTVPKARDTMPGRAELCDGEIELSCKRSETGSKELG